MASVNQSQRVMASISEQLLAAVDDLGTDQLKRFKWRLKNHYSFSATDLEKADAPDTVDLMTKRFGPEEAVKISVDILRKMNQNHVAEELEKNLKQAQADISIEDPAPVGAKLKPIKVTFISIVPRTRNDFLQYSHHLTLDLNTVNKNLRLSESNRVITHTCTVQLYPEHPDRFEILCQVLCRESMCGRSYWELQWSGFSVFISVSYKSIERERSGDECLFGRNDQSWSLSCFPSKYSFCHNKIETGLPVRPISSRIGVYVDHSAGILSYYSISDTMSLIHTVQTTFTQPLYPGIYVCPGSSVKLC
ncbi:tripartite motif-containing protein 16-like [Carassius auratus]|uniref:Tripartite motif-containing protein 16-like n=1 Tax=Carassius auratus TaxID=7957 RepID=A0A6P6P5G0_CARAU|nr:tripartite motif-containing protein 16-like [Carassius auratus]XP_026116376.1 tripartite motif-containing protein 16-like [Carassius auratus]